MRRILWVNGDSLRTVPIKHDEASYEIATSQVALVRCHKAMDKGSRRGKKVRPLITSNPKRDRSRKAVRQSGGYVTSGWRGY